MMFLANLILPFKPMLILPKTLMSMMMLVLLIVRERLCLSARKQQSESVFYRGRVLEIGEERENRKCFIRRNGHRKTGRQLAEKTSQRVEQRADVK
jgi:molybdopterin biosynthesis enzyme